MKQYKANTYTFFRKCEFATEVLYKNDLYNTLSEICI